MQSRIVTHLTTTFFRCGEGSDNDDDNDYDQVFVSRSSDDKLYGEKKIIPYRSLFHNGIFK
jgi:hypothetical protein